MKTYNLTEFSFTRFKKSETLFTIPLHKSCRWYNIINEIYVDKVSNFSLILNAELQPVPDKFKGKRICTVFNNCNLSSFRLNEVDISHDGDYSFIIYEHINKVFRLNKIRGIIE